MKRIIIAAMAFVFITSCSKRDDVRDVQQLAVVLTGNSEPDINAKPGEMFFIGSHHLSVRASYPIKLNMAIGGTIPTSKERNFGIVIRHLPDSSIAIPLSSVGLFQSLLSYTNTLPTGEYVVMYYIQTLYGTNGTVFLNTYASWQDQTGAVQNTPSVQTRTTTVSQYDNPPLVRGYTTDNVMQDSGYISYHTVVYNPSNEPIGLPQLAFQLNINDVDANDTIISYKQEVYENGINATNQIGTYNGGGVATTVFGEGLNKVIILHTTNAREAVVPAQDSLDIEVRFYISGLHNNGNGASIQGLVDNVVLSQDYYFLNFISAINRALSLTTSQNGGQTITVNMPFGRHVGSYSAVPGSSSRSFFVVPLAPLEIAYYHQ